MKQNVAKIGVRVLLAGAEARGRLHLRRILSGAQAVEIVGHIRPGSAVDEVVQRSGADVMLVDMGDGSPAAAAAIEAAIRLRQQFLALLPDRAIQSGVRVPIAAALKRPTDLDSETSQSPFGVALISRLLNYGTPVAATTYPPARSVLRTQMFLRPELIAIGSSTGGPQALPEVLAGVSGRVRQPIVITQHMPAAFTSMLAGHLARHTAAPTAEATDGAVLHPGHVYLAPGGRHLLIAKDGDRLVCQLNDGPPEHFCRPAVDPMLRSITANLGGRALAVILTGMGQDGLAGCRTLVEAGGAVVAQNEATSVVWGMPGAVAQAGLCRAVLPLNRIAEEIIILAGMQS